MCQKGKIHQIYNNTPAGRTKQGTQYVDFNPDSTHVPLRFQDINM